MNALRRLGGLSHGFWLDGPSREVIEDSSLARRIREEGLSGVTTRGRVSGGRRAARRRRRRRADLRNRLSSNAIEQEALAVAAA